MELIYTDESYSWQGSTERYSMDIAFGSDENDFELKMNKLDAVDEYGNLLFGVGCLVFVPGTEYGGIVDSIKVDATDYSTEITFCGRSWHGILAHSIIQPDRGQDYYSISGDCNTVIASMLDRQGLNGLFRVSKPFSGVVLNYTFNRYSDLYRGLMKALQSVGMRLSITRSGGYTELEAVKAESYSNGSTTSMQEGLAKHSEFVGYEMKKAGRTVNHLVCLGTGELKNRTVINLYADEEGNVSMYQTFFGVDEVAEVYDYSQAEYDNLLEEGTKKLKSCQEANEASINVSSISELAIGDTVEAYSEELGLSAVASIQKIIVKLNFDDEPEIEYSVGVDEYEEGIV